tara:strand:+ start:108 stop:776 length:669 start_codon:yes stop_codon:yes gene_type:complete
MDDLTLVVPAKNEAETLPTVLKDLEKYKLNTIVVLEKEDINTIDAIKNLNCKILYQEGLGYGDALIQGINNVNTKYFCIFNADGSFLSRELKEMYKYLKEYNFDFVFGSRYMKNGYSEDDTIITLIGNRIFSFLGKIFFSLEISDILYTYVMGDTEKAKGLEMKEKKFAFCVELPIKAKKRGYKLISIPSYEKPRIAGRKKVNAFKDGFIILFSMIKFFIFK